MSDDNSGNRAKLSSDRVNGTLNFLFISLIEGTCGLIEKQNLWLFDECSRDCDSLFLTAGELATCIAHTGVNAMI
jgi:hypothetical protein